ncbi:MAG: ABC transporter permease [Akkermansiaceae bacterium]
MKREELRVTLPSLLWLLIFVGVPTLLVFAIAFKSPDGQGGMGQDWSLSAIRSLASPHYPQIIWRTLWISTVTTFLCLCIALPVAWTMARASRRAKSWLLLFVVIPFWTNFLIRVFAWKQILHAEGLFARILKQWHWMDPDATLLYHPMAVVLVSVYAFLPFAILPIYAVAEKFDFSLLEAARDLGAGSFRAIYHVFLPGIRRGIATATIVVFIPMLGSYVIPDLVGGKNAEMIGNQIAQRNFSDRNLPQAAALSAALTVFVLLPFALRKTRSV